LLTNRVGMGWVSQSSNTSNIMTAAASVPNLTGLGNGAEAPEDMEEVLHRALTAWKRCYTTAAAQRPAHGASSCSAPAHLLLPRPADPAPHAPGASWPHAPSTRPRPRAPAAPLMSLPPRAAPALPYAPVATATTFIGRREEEQQQEGTNAVAEGRNECREEEQQQKERSR
jgi:hypothetical protein